MSENEIAEQQTAHKQAGPNQEQPGRAGRQATAIMPAPPQELFNREELKQFDADDTQVGRAIGKMLAIFFLYTLIMTSIAVLWTYSAISQ